MKKTLLLLTVLLSVVVCAQEKSSVLVKEATVASGAVIVTVDFGGKAVDLQCTQGMPACVSLKPGKYVMVQLPKNHGMYDCQNVDIYADGADPGSAQRIGAFCLIPK